MGRERELDAALDGQDKHVSQWRGFESYKELPPLNPNDFRANYRPSLDKDGSWHFVSERWW